VGRASLRHALCAALYACVCLSVLWNVLAMAALLDVYGYVRFGIVDGVGEIIAVLGIGGSWVWVGAMWWAAVRWRVAARRRTTTWLASQVSAAGAVAGFGFIDRYLPF
jgi:hypothetical protein